MRDTLRNAWGAVSRFWNADLPPEKLEEALAELRAKQPAPTFWLFGKTQSGKSSIVKYLTGSDDAAIGSGFRPCTKYSRKYPFPNADAPILNFLDTRGLDEPGYDPAEDINAFASEANLLIVTVKIRDFAQATVKESLKAMRAANPQRPVVLVLTCLHEALAGSAHPQPYPFASTDGPEPFSKLIAEHRDTFAGLHDAVVPIDFVKPEEGFAVRDYGGEELRQTLLNLLPEAYRQSLAKTADAIKTLKDLHQQAAGPVIVAYASMAATAAAMPVPFVSLVTLPGVQSRMVYHLAKLYGQEMNATRYLELAGSLGIGLIARQAVREVAKFIPFVGSAVGAALAWASTYALGRAMCLYFEEIHSGHVPKPERLKHLYQEQFEAAKRRWQSETA